MQTSLGRIGVLAFNFYFMLNENMTDDDESATKRRGRSPGGAHEEFVGLRLPPGLVQAIDAWRATEPGLASRSSAVRRLIQLGLAARGVEVAEPPAPASIDQRISRLEKRVARSVPDGPPSPQRGMKVLRKGLAETKLRGLRQKRNPTSGKDK